MARCQGSTRRARTGQQGLTQTAWDPPRPRHRLQARARRRRRACARPSRPAAAAAGSTGSWAPCSHGTCGFMGGRGGMARVEGRCSARLLSRAAPAAAAAGRCQAAKGASPIAPVTRLAAFVAALGLGRGARGPSARSCRRLHPLPAAREAGGCTSEPGRQAKRELGDRNPRQFKKSSAASRRRSAAADIGQGPSACPALVACSSNASHTCKRQPTWRRPSERVWTS